MESVYTLSIFRLLTNYNILIVLVKIYKSLFLSLPPRGRGTAAGFPETNEMSFGGSRIGGGRSLRYGIVLLNFIITHSPSVSFADSSLPEGALCLCKMTNTYF